MGILTYQFDGAAQLGNTPSRQRIRREYFRGAFAGVTEKFPGELRKFRRKIAWATAKRVWKEQKERLNAPSEA